MKWSILNGAVLFAAGVGCTVVAQSGWTPGMEAEEVLEKRVNALLIEVSQLGAYVTLAENGRVVFNLDPIRCPTPIPLPKLPANAVDPRTLRQGAAALFTVDEAYLLGATDPMGSEDRCQTAR
jgi:hypothetical protein